MALTSSSVPRVLKCIRSQDTVGEVTTGRGLIYTSVSSYIMLMSVLGAVAQTRVDKS